MNIMEGSVEDLPFVAEYAKSSRATCKACNLGIDKDSFRLAAMAQSPKFDGKVPNWYHFGCFWKKNKITNVGDVKGYGDLRLEDQEKLKAKIASGAGSGPAGLQYAVEYAKSNRSKCKSCKMQIKKGTVRLSKRDFADLRTGKPMDHWYHVDCFTKIVLVGSLAVSEIESIAKLDEEDQTKLAEVLKLSKKRKAPVANDSADGGDQVDSKQKGSNESELEKQLQQQTKMLWALKDGLKMMKSSAIKKLLSINDQHVPTGEKPLLEHLVDLLMFGALDKCPECQSEMMYKGDSYHCAGHISGWTKCMYRCQDPGRRPLKIPDEYREQFIAMNKYKYVKRKRLFAAAESTSQMLAKQNLEAGATSSGASSSELSKSVGGSKKSINVGEAGDAGQSARDGDRLQPAKRRQPQDGLGPH